MRVPLARRRGGVVVALATALSACARGPVTPVDPREPWPEELRLDGRVLVSRDLEAESTLADPRPARLVPEPTIYAAAVAELLRDSAVDIFGELFRAGATGAVEAGQKGFRAVVSPRVLRVPGTFGLAFSLSLSVQLRDEDGKPIHEDRFEGGTLQGPDDFPPGLAGPRLGGAARRKIDLLVRRAAEATREAAIERAAR